MDEKQARILENRLREREIVCSAKKGAKAWVVEILPRCQKPIVIRNFHRQISFNF